MNMSFLTHCALFLLPGWKDVLGLPVPERIAKLRDPEVRALLQRRARSDGAGVLRRLTDWKAYVLGDTYATANAGLKGRRVGEVATERDQEPFDALCDIVIADDLRTVLWPSATDNDEGSWSLRAEVGVIPACCSEAPTPARTSTGCAVRPTRRGSSATCCGGGSS